MRRIAVAVTTLGITSILLATTAWALITPVKVLGLPAVQVMPFSNDAYLTFTSNSTTRPKHFDAIAYRYADGKKRRVNAAHTQGWNGGLDPTTNTVIYQQAANGDSDIYTFDLDALDRNKVGAIDTPRWEWMPRISTAFISFFRDYKANGKTYTGIYLYDRSSGKLRKLEAIPNAHVSVSNGTLGERYATWTVCGKATCTAYVYDTQSRSRKTIKTNNGRPQYAPAVDEVNGLVFFARSGFGCGKGVTFYELPVGSLGATPTKVGSLPTGFDLDGIASLALNPDTIQFDYFFARVKCSSGAFDTYALRSVSPGV